MEKPRLLYGQPSLHSSATSILSRITVSAYTSLRSFLFSGNEKTQRKGAATHEIKNKQTVFTLVPVAPQTKRFLAPRGGCNQHGQNQQHDSAEEHARTSRGNGSSTASQGVTSYRIQITLPPFLVVLDLANENMAASLLDFSRSGADRADPSPRPPLPLQES